MNHSQVKEIVEKSIHDSHNYNFMVTMANGDKKKMRMFISEGGWVCEFKKRSRTRGRCISCEELWDSVVPINKNTDKVRVCKRNTKSIIKYLTISGFWPDILANMTKLQELSDEDLRYLTECEYDKHNTFMLEHGIDHISPDMFCTFANGEYIWTEGSRITGINYYSEREQSMLDGLRKQEIASLDKSLQGDWFPIMCLRDIDDGTIFRVDSHNADYSDNYGDEIRMAIYDKGKDLHGKPSQILMGVYHIEGSDPSSYLYCSNHLDMIWLSVELNYSEDCEAYRMKFYERGEETERTVDDCYWLDLLK